MHVLITGSLIAAWLIIDPTVDWALKILALVYFLCLGIIGASSLLPKP